jgi:tight junction protein 4 (peripheral)
MHEHIRVDSSTKDVSDIVPEMAPSICRECGCRCDCCGNGPSAYLDLQQQIAELHSQLHRSGTHISNIEHELLDSRQSMDVELMKTKEELNRLRERYDRLLESHKKMQKINHDLEDKLLKMVGQFETEKLALQKELSTMMSKLVDARVLINQLDEESERYRIDCNTAAQLLQCKPSTFVAHKLNTLPVDLQERVKQHMTREQLIAAENGSSVQQEEQKLIHVPIATFPPTAMVFSLNQNINKQPEQQTQSELGFVPMSLIARVLTQSESRRVYPRMFLCMMCKRDVFHEDKGCQVDLLARTTRTVEITTKHSKDRNQSFVHNSSPKSNFTSINLSNSSSHESVIHGSGGRERFESISSENDTYN